MTGRSERQPRLWPWLAPTLLLIAAVVVYPAVEMVRTSLLDLNSIGLAQGFAGLGNFQTLFDEPALGHVVRNTVVWVVVVDGAGPVAQCGVPGSPAGAMVADRAMGVVAGDDRDDLAIHLRA